MAEDVQKPAVTPEKVEPAAEGKKMASMDDLAALKAENEAIKKMLSGSDQKITQLLQDLKRKEETKATAEERIAALERETAEAKRQAERERFNSAGYKLGAEFGIESEIAAIMVDRFNGSLEELKTIFAKLKAKNEASEQKGRQALYRETEARPGPAGEQRANIESMSSKEKMRLYEKEFEKRLKDRGA